MTFKTNQKTAENVDYLSSRNRYLRHSNGLLCKARCHSRLPRDARRKRTRTVSAVDHPQNSFTSEPRSAWTQGGRSLSEQLIVAGFHRSGTSLVCQLLHR